MRLGGDGRELTPFDWLVTHEAKKQKRCAASHRARPRPVEPEARLRHDTCGICPVSGSGATLESECGKQGGFTPHRMHEVEE